MIRISPKYQLALYTSTLAPMMFGLMIILVWRGNWTEALIHAAFMVGTIILWFLAVRSAKLPRVYKPSIQIETLEFPAREVFFELLQYLLAVGFVVYFEDGGWSAVNYIALMFMLVALDAGIGKLHINLLFWIFGYKVWKATDDLGATYIIITKKSKKLDCYGTFKGEFVTDKTLIGVV